MTPKNVCVVGSGPVGLPLSVRLAQGGLRVLLLEAGSQAPDRVHQSDLEAQTSADSRHAPMNLAVCRALGGTSWLWGGRCVPLDAIDFAVRLWIPESGWPLQEKDVAPYYQAAAAALGCGPAEFLCSGPQIFAGGLNLDKMERWCNKPLLPAVRDNKSLPGNIFLCLDTMVTGLSLTPDKTRVRGARIASGEKTTVFSGPPIFVLACGGLETTRLLLNVQAQQPELFGGTQGPLGRHYMGHLSGHIANIVFDDPRRAVLFAYRDSKDSAIRCRMTLSEGAQTAKQLPNISFAPDNPKMNDPAHGSGILSAIFLLLCTPVIGPRLISEAIRQMQMTDNPRYLQHLRNILLDFPRTFVTALNLAWQKFVIGRRKPFLFLPSRSGEYPLHYHAEHIGHAESRVQLGDELDVRGLRRLKIDQRFTQRDSDGVVRAHQALDEALRKSRLGRLVYHDGAEARGASVLAQVHDGFHQMGLLRMGTHAQDGVVDQNCRVFGLDNMFVVGTGVFRTSGQANPTFFATALGLRVADHIAEGFPPRTAAK